MIGKIKGTLSEIDGNSALIETSSGVFYEVFLTPSLLLTPLGEQIEIYTYLQVREDAQILFGFKEKKEHSLFKILLSVSGIGPKTAFGIISRTQPEALFKAVSQNDLSYFSKIPGLGKKTAMKLMLELSQKLNQEFQLEKMYTSEDDKLVIDALSSLGFRSVDAKKILSQLPNDLSVENKISQAIRLATRFNKKV